MSTKDILAEIYPALYENAEAVFPQYGFKKIPRGYVSTTGEKVT